MHPQFPSASHSAPWAVFSFMQDDGEREDNSECKSGVRVAIRVRFTIRVIRGQGSKGSTVKVKGSENGRFRVTFEIV